MHPSKQQESNGFKINTMGLSLMTNVQTCDDGMSPLMQRFTAGQKNKK